MGLSCYTFQTAKSYRLSTVSMPLWAWVVTRGWQSRGKTRSCFNALMGLSCYKLLMSIPRLRQLFQCPYGLELLHQDSKTLLLLYIRFNALMGLSCYAPAAVGGTTTYVSMPLWAWVVTAIMSNILNFSWYFLCIPAIYRCILAYLPIFFNQLSKFLRCESPSTFLGTCLSHHSFIIFLVTNTNTLLSGLYLISTWLTKRENGWAHIIVSMPSRAYTSFLLLHSV